MLGKIAIAIAIGVTAALVLTVVAFHQGHFFCGPHDAEGPKLGGAIAIAGCYR